MGRVLVGEGRGLFEEDTSRSVGGEEQDILERCREFEDPQGQAPPHFQELLIPELMHTPVSRFQDQNPNNIKFCI